jgi:hypothetical protein
MPGKVGRPRKPDGIGSQVRIDAGLAKMARRVADFRGLKLLDYLSEILRPTIVKDYKQTNEEIDAEVERKGKEPSPKR